MIPRGIILSPVKTNTTTAAATTTPCLKCGGRGKIERFSNIAEGDCFECGATGRVSTISRGRVAPDAIEAPVMDAECVVARMRVWYKNARTYGAEWFANEGESGVGMSAVRWHAQYLDAVTAARIVAAFEALAADA